LPLVGVGTGLLWFGWFGFNGGSAMGINPQAISAAFATTIAALSAGIVWVLLEWKKFGKPTSLGLFTGYIAGLATITPASGFVDVLGAFFIGIVGAILCFWAVVYLKNRFKYDDSLDVFGVHGIGGIAGSILLAFFAKSSIGNINGIFYGAKFSVLIPQIIAVIVVGIYSIIGTFAIFKIVEKFIGLRVSIEDEIAGLDENIHGESAYAKEY
jgi:Amt family ammonium transporter